MVTHECLTANKLENRIWNLSLANLHISQTAPLIAQHDVSLLYRAQSLQFNFQIALLEVWFDLFCYEQRLLKRRKCPSYLKKKQKNDQTPNRSGGRELNSPAATQSQCFSLGFTKNIPVLGCVKGSQTFRASWLDENNYRGIDYPQQYLLILVRKSALIYNWRIMPLIVVSYPSQHTITALLNSQ